MYEMASTSFSVDHPPFMTSRRVRMKLRRRRPLVVSTKCRMTLSATSARSQSKWPAAFCSHRGWKGRKAWITRAP